MEAIALVCRERHALLAARAQPSPSACSAAASGFDGGVSTEGVRAISARVPSDGVVLRVQDACVTSEVFGSLKCDCRPQLDFSMALLFHVAAREGAIAAAAAAGAVAMGTVADIGGAGAVAAAAPSPSRVLGVIVYLLQEGRGVGLAAKVAAYALQEPSGGSLDTVDANRALGLPDDVREYGAVADVLADLGVGKGEGEGIYFLSNNPRKKEALAALGVHIKETLPCLVRPAGALAREYLRAKAERMGHDIPREVFQE
jgi:GTP cyclohydrolase II